MKKLLWIVNPHAGRGAMSGKVIGCVTAFQQALAMDNLLEQAEVNFRTLCDLLRYHYWKQAGAVSSVDEFLELFR